MNSSNLNWALGVCVILIVYLFINNNTLNQKINACAFNIGVMNSSITQANSVLRDAKDKAWTDYETMGTTLAGLDGSYPNQDNPCDKNYTGDLSNFPSQ